MSVLVVGLSHKSAPVTTLERAVLTGDALGKLLRDVFHADDVAGSLVVSTCNRVEVYADVDKFHGGVSAICELLARHAGIPLAELTPHLYVHYEDRADPAPAAGGLRARLHGDRREPDTRPGAPGPQRWPASRARSAGPCPTWARSRCAPASARTTETGIDRAGASLVSVGLTRPPPSGCGPEAAGDGAPGLAGLSVLVVGAGSMSSLAVATAARMGAPAIVVANRIGHAGPAAGRDRLRRHRPTWPACPAEIAAADLVVSCTGAPGHVITAGRGGRGARPGTPARAAGPAGPGAAARRRPGRRPACPA